MLLHYRVLKPFLAFLGQELRVRVRKPRDLPSYYDAGDIERLIVQAERGLPGQAPAVRLENAALILLMAYAGLRRGEAVALTVADVDFERRLIRVRQGKGGVDRNAPMAETLVVPLRELCRGRGRRSRLFTVSPAHCYRRMVKLARACGLEGFHPHSLRHAFATRLVARGANLKAVQQLLGHASLETTAVYLDMAPEHLRAAVVPRERSPLLRGAATRSCHAEVTLPRPTRGIIDRPKPGYDALGSSLTWTIAFCS